MAIDHQGADACAQLKACSSHGGCIGAAIKVTVSTLEHFCRKPPHSMSSKEPWSAGAEIR